MANEEHLAILKQGVEVWNQWRGQNTEIVLDLTEAPLPGADLRGANFAHTIMSGANLKTADLRGADLAAANLRGAELNAANLGNSNFSGADLLNANLADANLREAHLANANFKNVNFQGTDFGQARVVGSVFGNNDLSGVKGIDTGIHIGPSTIGIDTISNSKGTIPESFLRGCGLSDWQIENAKLFNPDLSNEEISNVLYKIHDLRVRQAVQIKPLFISYSRSDGAFVDSIEPRLNQRGIRYWRDIHHATSGKLERQIDQAVRSHPIVLLVLSANSVESDWVQHEARLARKLEQETKCDVLCPIALDDTWKTCDWPERLREQIMEYNVLDFSQWQDQSQFDRMFARLIEGLGIFYK